MIKQWSAWTEEEFEMLQSLIKIEAPSASFLAMMLNRNFPQRQKLFTRNAVIGKCLREGLQLPNLSGRPSRLSNSKQPKAKTGKLTTVEPRKIVSVPVIPISRQAQVPATIDSQSLYQKKGTCQYVINSKQPYKFCGAKSNGPWCEKHKKKVFQKK